MSEPVPSPAIFDETRATGTRALSGTVWGTLQQLVPQLYTLAQSIAVARFLTVSDMGLQSFIAWCALGGTFLWSRSVPVALARSVAHAAGRSRPDLIKGLVARSVVAEVAAATATTVVLIGVGSLRGDALLPWALASAASAATLLRNTPQAFLRGIQRWRDASVVGLATGAVGTVAIVAVLAAGGGISSIFAVQAVVGAVSTAWAWTLAFPRLRRVRSAAEADRVDAPLPRDSGFAKLASSGFVLALFTFVVWQRSEFVLLERYSDTRQIALFSIGFGAIGALARIPLGAATAVTPSVANLLATGDDEVVRRGFVRSSLLLAAVVLPLTAAAITVLPDVVVAVYGERYRDAGVVTAVMAAALPAAAAYQLGVAVMQGVGRLRGVLLATAIAAVVDVALGVALIPESGASGAAVASLAAQSSLGVWVFVVAARALGVAAVDLVALWRPTVAAAAGGAAAAASLVTIDGWGGTVGAAVAVSIAVVLMCRTIGLVPAADIDWLIRAVGPRASMLRVLVPRRDQVGTRAGVR